jgi:hypothetical protein
MHLTALSDASSALWWWKIVDTNGDEVARSASDYPSVAEALEAGRVAFREVVRRHMPTSARRDQAFGRSRRSA